jgi:hypothetical protein
MYVYRKVSRVPQSVQCLTTDWNARVRSPKEAENISSSLCPRPTQPPVQWVPVSLSPGVKSGRDVMLTTHPLLVPRSRNERGYISSPSIGQNWHVICKLYPFACSVTIVGRPLEYDVSEWPWKYPAGESQLHWSAFRNNFPGVSN